MKIHDPQLPASAASNDAESEPLFSAQERAALRRELAPSAARRARVREHVLSSVAAGTLTPSARRVDALMRGHASGVAGAKATGALHALSTKIMVVSLVVAGGATAVVLRGTPQARPAAYDATRARVDQPRTSSVPSAAPSSMHVETPHTAAAQVDEAVATQRDTQPAANSGAASPAPLNTPSSRGSTRSASGARPQAVAAKATTAPPTAAVGLQPAAAATSQPLAAAASRSTATGTPQPPAAATSRPTTAATSRPTTAATSRPTTAVTSRPTTAATSRPTAAVISHPNAVVTSQPLAAATSHPHATAPWPPTAAATSRATAAVTSQPLAAATSHPHAAATSQPLAAATSHPYAAAPSLPTAAVTSQPNAALRAPEVAPAAGAAKEPQLQLSNELALMKQASDALGRRDTDTALRTLEHYEARFPAGALHVEAEALRAIALCHAHAADSAAASAQFMRAHAHSALAERVQHACSARTNEVERVTR